MQINGEYHCTVRYRQLHKLDSELRALGAELPQFPPKKYWPLSTTQIEERRALLEKYIQAGMFLGFQIIAYSFKTRLIEMVVCVFICINLGVLN